jgi:hypothetical protein
MIFGYFTLIVALIISAIAAYYSIIGLTAIFSAAVIPIMIMGASLEVGKVTAAVWLKMYWERASLLYKFYLVPAVAFLMLLTSMGIFGFLSKAHSDQSLVSGDSMARVAIYDEKIKVARDNIDADRKALKQMDEAVDQVMARSGDEKGADKAVAIRRGQQKERQRLLADIETEQKKIGALNEERAPLAAENRKIESEVGPIKYIAALVYGDNPDTSILEKAVRLVIMIIVAVFDPLALVLILAAQQSIRWAREEKNGEIREETTPVEVNKHTQAEEEIPPEGEPEPSFSERHPYLTNPFVHFKDLIPMVFRPEKTEHTIMEDTAAMAIVPPEEEDVRPFTEEEIEALANANSEVTVVEDTAPQVHYIEDSEHIHYQGKSYGIESFKIQHPELSALADNHPSLSQPAKAEFGTEFPTNPDKGDMYLRTDFLPNRQYKFNGSKWIEVESVADVLAYDEQYIKHLVTKISNGEYDVEELTDVEREQIAEYLKKSENN